MISVGIVGTSWWTEAMYLPALADHPDARVSALCGRSTERARELAARWGVGQTFGDWRALIDHGGLDAVIIASSNDTHYPIAMASLDAGIHVLCEKPLALTATEADRMAARAAETGLATLVPFTYRYMPVFAETKRLVDEGFLGTPYHLNLRYFAQYGVDPRYAWRFDRDLAGSGVTGDLGSHWLDLAEWLFGPIDGLGAVAATFVPRGPRPDGRPYQQTEDSTIMTVRFASGAMGTLQTCSVSWEGTPFGQTHHLDAHGSAGTVYATCDWDRVQEVRALGTGEPGPAPPVDWAPRWPGVRLDRVHDTYRDVFRTTDAMTRGWVHDIAAGRTTSPDFAVGARVQHLIETALDSMEQDGRLLPVHAPPTMGEVR